MYLTMKNTRLHVVFLMALIILLSCKKQEVLVALPVPEVKLSTISFKQDTLSVSLSITTARKEKIGNLFTTSVEGKLPDSVLQKNNLIIRLTGDSARKYSHTEILASYTDSLGNTYANSVSDTFNIVTVSKLQKISKGIVEGNFTIRVSNTTKTKTLLLTEGKFSTGFIE